MADPLSKGDFIAREVQSKNKQDRHGNDVYSCKLEDKAGVEFEDVYVARKKDLQEGYDLYGRVENNEYGLRFFPMQREDTAPSSNGGSRPSNRVPDDARQRSIIRQHSEEMALRLIAASGDAKDLDLSDAQIVGAYLNTTVKRLIDWFYKDAGGTP